MPSMKEKLINFVSWVLVILISGLFGAGLVYVALTSRY